MVYRVYFQFNTFENLLHFFFGNVCAQEFIDPFRRVRQFPCFSLIRIAVYNAGNNFAAAQHFNQLCSSVNSIHSQVGIQTFFEFAGSVCTQTNFLCCDTNVRTIENSGFEQNSFCAFTDLGVFTTHYTCDCNCFFRVGDYQHGRIQLTFYAVQCCDFFAFVCVSYNDMSVFNGVNVESVHRLTHFQHYIVGNIYDVVNRTNPCGTQSFTHPTRRRSDFYIFDSSCHITRAQCRIFDFYGNQIRCFAFAFFFYCNFRRAIRDFVCCSRFSGNTQNAEAVRTVGSDFVFYYIIFQIQYICNIFAQFYRFRENINAVFRCFGEIVSVKAQFFDGAKHTFGSNASQVACVNFLAACDNGIIQCNGNIVPNSYVRCAGNDCQIFASAHINGANHQFVCVGVFFNGFDMTCDNVFQFSCHRSSTFYFRTAHCHIFHKVFQRCSHRCIFF